MKAVDLIHGLSKFLVLAKAIAEKIDAEGVQFEVSLSYDTIDLKLKTNGSDEFSALLQCSFEIKPAGVIITEVIAENKQTESTVRFFLKEQSEMGFLSWDPESNDTSLPSEVERYLDIADAIAGEAYHYSSGDDYRPGCYTRVILASKGITLTQINRHNSRSSDHKKDYFMRELRFFIPFGTEMNTTAFGEELETIGKMQIVFSDHSSPQNRTAGDNIKAKIMATKKSSKF